MDQSFDQRVVRGFTYPIPRTSSVYDELGMDATATDQQLGATVTGTIKKLDRERGELQNKIDDAIARIPGFRESLHQEMELAKSNPPAKIPTNLKTKLTEMHRAVLQIAPDFEYNKQRCREIEAEIKRWKDLSLDTPEHRQKYEQQHPPLALLKLRDCSRTRSADRRAALSLIRREVSAFLEAQGEPVFHPSDLTRRDFRGDYQPNDLLDPPEDSE